MSKNAAEFMLAIDGRAMAQDLASAEQTIVSRLRASAERAFAERRPVATATAPVVASISREIEAADQAVARASQRAQALAAATRSAGAVIDVDPLKKQLPVLTDYIERTESLRKRGIEPLGESFEASHRKAANFAHQGLAAVADVHPQLSSMLVDLAAQSPKVAAGLGLIGTAASAVGAALVGVRIGQELRFFLEHGEFFSQWQERTQRAIDAERSFQGVLTQSGDLSRQLKRERLDAIAATTAAQLRAGGDEIRALDVEFQRKRQTIDEDERIVLAALNKLQRDAFAQISQEEHNALALLGMTATSGIDAEQRRTEAAATFSAKRRQLVQEESDAINRARDADFEKEQQRAQAVLAAKNTAQQAELAVQAQSLQGEGRLAQAAAITARQRIAQVNFERDERLRALDAQVRADAKFAAQAADIRVQIAKETNAKLRVIDEERLAAQRALSSAAAAAEQSIGGPRLDTGALRQSIADQRAGIIEARRQLLQDLVQPVGPTFDQASGASLIFGGGAQGLVNPLRDIGAQLERINAVNAALAQLEQRERALADAEAQLAREQQRPQLMFGLEAVDKLEQNVNTLADRFAKLEKDGVPLTQLFPEIDRQASDLAEQYRILTEQFAASPAVLDRLREKLGDLEFGGFSQRVTDTGKSGAFLADSMNQVDGSLRRVSGSSESAVGQFDAVAGRMAIVTFRALEARDAIRELDAQLAASEF